MTLLLLFLPRTPINISDTTTPSNRGIVFTRLLKWGAVGFVALVGAGIIWHYLFRMKYPRLNVPNDFHSTGNLGLIAAAFVLFIIYLLMVLKPIRFDLVKVLTQFWKNLNWKSVVLLVVFLGGMQVLTKLLANPAIPNPYTMSGFIVRLFGEPLVYPLQFLETSFLYYGLLLVLVIIFWKQLVPLLGQYGFGYLVVIIYTVVFSTQAESRFVINMIPFFLFPLMSLLDKKAMKKWVPHLFIFLQLIISKFWYPFNAPGIEESFDKRDFLNFPAQRYYMNQGPWQSFDMYLLFGAIFLLVLVFVYWGNKKSWFWITTPAAPGQ
jgi:hypothetical protein